MKSKGRLEMKSRMSFFVAAVAVLTASVASAGTLFWQVNDDSEDDVTAQLYVQQGNNEAGRIALSNELDSPTGVQEADISKYTDDTYLFYVELLNYTKGTVTQGYKWGYGDLYLSGYVSFNGSNLPDARLNAIALGNFANAPEPSSGLLLLMGGAMLALRRRRQK